MKLTVTLVAIALLLGPACDSNAPHSGGDAVLGAGPPRTTAAPPPTTRLPGRLGGSGALVTPNGVVVPVASSADGQWTVTTPCGRTASVTGGTLVPSAAVVLDPGHGGWERGAVSPAGLPEASVNLAVAGYAKAALEAAGVSVLLTRTADYDMELAPRAELGKAVGALAFVSVHHNAEPDGPWPRPGSETYYQIGSPDSKRLAGLIYEEVLKALSPYPVAWAADRDAGAKYRQGHRGDYYAVLRLPAPVVSALVELAYISNPPEAALLARADVQKVEGDAVARGILRYLTTPDPGSGFTEPYPRPDLPPSPGGEAPPCRDPAL